MIRLAWTFHLDNSKLVNEEQGALNVLQLGPGVIDVCIWCLQLFSASNVLSEVNVMSELLNCNATSNLSPREGSLTAITALYA